MLHKVEKNENFWTISRMYYNSGRYYKALWKANEDKVAEIDKLYRNTVIRIPPPEDLDPAYIEPARDPSPAPGCREPGRRRPRSGPPRAGPSRARRRGADTPLQPVRRGVEPPRLRRRDRRGRRSGAGPAKGYPVRHRDPGRP